jgi:hypothetical protein
MFVSNWTSRFVDRHVCVACEVDGGIEGRESGGGASSVGLAAPCMSSHGSPRLNSCFAPRLSRSTPHEPTTPASNHPRVPAPTESLRLIWPTMSCQSSLQPLPATAKNTISPCNCRAQPPTTTSELIKTCSTIYRTHRLPRGGGFLEVAVSEAPLPNSSIRLPAMMAGRTREINA